MDTTASPDHPNPSLPQVPTQHPPVQPHSASHDPELNLNSSVLPQFASAALPSIATQPPPSLLVLQISSLQIQPSILHPLSAPQCSPAPVVQCLQYNPCPQSNPS